MQIMNSLVKSELFSRGICCLTHMLLRLQGESCLLEWLSEVADPERALILTL